jgi:hypothetical protein
MVTPWHDAESTQHVVVMGQKSHDRWRTTKKWTFSRTPYNKGSKMEEKKFDLKNGNVEQQITDSELSEIFEQETARFVDEFFDSVGSTPMGKLLEIISALPAIREEKVFDIRQQISEETYDLERRFDTAVEKVFEEYLL